jgi:hypothetical protein
LGGAGPGDSMDVGGLRPLAKRMHPLAQKAAEIALRLASLPADGLQNNTQTLDEVEQLAVQILKEVSAARIGKSYSVGETSGMWRAMQPLRRQ